MSSRFLGGLSGAFKNGFVPPENGFDPLEYKNKAATINYIEEELIEIH